MQEFLYFERKNMKLFKYSFILSLVSLFLSSQLFSQITVSSDSLNSQIISGTEIIIDTIPSSNIDISNIYIFNNLGASDDFFIVRRTLSQPDGWYNGLCWGTLCYPTSSDSIWTTPVSENINNSSYQKLKPYYIAPDQGSGHYRYYISTDGVTFLDSVDVILNVTSTIGINDFSMPELNIYPNPTASIIYIEGLEKTKYNIEIFNLNGQIIKKSILSTVNSIDLTELDMGEYILVATKQDDGVRLSKKIVIRK